MDKDTRPQSWEMDVKPGWSSCLWFVFRGMRMHLSVFYHRHHVRRNQDRSWRTSLWSVFFFQFGFLIVLIPDHETDLTWNYLISLEEEEEEEVMIFGQYFYRFYFSSGFIALVLNCGTFVCLSVEIHNIITFLYLFRYIYYVETAV